MDSIENIAMMLEPDNEIKRIRIVLRLREILTEVHLYRMEHPDTTLSSEKIMKYVKHRIAWRIVSNYMFRPYKKLRQAFMLI